MAGLLLVALTSVAAATTGTTPSPSKPYTDSVYVYYDVVYEGRYVGGNIYAIPPGTPQVEFKCHVVRPSTPLKWFLEAEDKQRIDLATVDYATQSVVRAISEMLCLPLPLFQETSDELSWIPEASGPVTTFTLIVKNFTKQLAGKYSCEAYNGEKKVGSREYILGVDGESSNPHDAQDETYPTIGSTPSD
ncbi:hypothetical protein AAVH_11502 [Aphelenchoides avenae]|nr:hypothetical protein AAVH_11502 [Aphelenchus avenae]